MVHNERRAIVPLAIIMACRMLGLFMILPFFSVYATHLANATPFLIGFALGIYGLTQACLQIPLGSLSDRIGRKKVITFGLILLAIGSVVAALSHSIYGIILGRALQGAGAIGSTILATAADLTRDESRSKAMAILGLTIGIAFFIAIIIGPLINHWLQLSGIFWSIFGLALLAIVLLHTIVPNPSPLFMHREPRLKPILKLLKNKELLRLNVGIFTLHALLTATFIAIPLLLTHHIHISQLDQTLLYLCIMLVSFAFMLPLITVAEKKRKMRLVLLLTVTTLLLCELTLAYFQTSLWIIIISLLAFFTAFCWLETSLPSLVSKIAPIKHKGAAMGIHSTAQFLGIFMGGTLGGLIFSHAALTGLFLFCASLSIFWLFVATRMHEPPYLSTCIFKINPEFSEQNTTMLHELTQLHGVAEATTMPHEGLIYIKADHKIISKDQLRKVIDKSNLRR